MNEFNFISKYLSKLAKKNTSSKNLNDDVFFDKNKNVVISTDTYVEGVHFLNFRNLDISFFSAPLKMKNSIFG